MVLVNDTVRDLTRGTVSVGRFQVCDLERLKKFKNEIFTEFNQKSPTTMQIINDIEHNSEDPIDLSVLYYSEEAELNELKELIKSNLSTFYVKKLMRIMYPDFYNFMILNREFGLYYKEDRKYNYDYPFGIWDNEKIFTINDKSITVGDIKKSHENKHILSLGKSIRF